MCPNGGVYHYDQGTLICSYHSDGAEGPSDIPEGTIAFDEGHIIQAEYSWDELVDLYSGSNVGENTTFFDGTEFYIWPYIFRLNQNETIDDCLADNRCVKILTDSLIFEEDWDDGVNVKKGSVKFENENYYVWISDGADNVKVGHWIYNNVALWRLINP